MLVAEITEVIPACTSRAWISSKAPVKAVLRRTQLAGIRVTMQPDAIQMLANANSAAIRTRD